MKNCTHLTATLSLTVLAALAGTAGTARAQCDAFRPGTYDFDQLRTAAPGILGVPFGGTGHCIPTSWASIVAYMVNHGAPELNFGFTLNWSDPANYNAQSLLITEIGNLMGTDDAGSPTFGPGMMQFFASRGASDNFIVGGKGYTAGDPPSPNDALEVLLSGGFACAVRGTYLRETNTPALVRSTGHIMSVRHVYDGCSSTPKLGLRDPVSSDATTTASAPAVYSDTLVLTNRFFRIADTNAVELRGVYTWPNVNTSAAFKALDCIEIVTPAFAIGSVTVGQEAGINMMRPQILTEPLRPVLPGPIPLPLAHIDALHVDPSLAYMWAIGTTPGGSTAITKVGAGTLQIKFTVEVADTLVSSFVSRKGQLYFVSAGGVKRLDLSGPAPTTTTALLIPARQVVRCIATDDSTDSIVVVTDSGIAEAPLVDGTTVGPFTPFPVGVEIGGQTTGVVKHGTGTLVLGSANYNKIHVLSRSSAGGGWLLNQTINLPAGTQPRNIQLTNSGSIIYTSAGIVAELERDATGGYVPKANSFFAGSQVDSAFAVASSRNVRGETTGVTGNQLSNDLENNPNQADCLTDFNNDGQLNPDDLADFIGAYFAADGTLVADFNGDFDVNPDDLADFIGAFFAGCP